MKLSLFDISSIRASDVGSEAAVSLVGVSISSSAMTATGIEATVKINESNTAVNRSDNPDFFIILSFPLIVYVLLGWSVAGLAKFRAQMRVPLHLCARVAKEQRYGAVIIAIF